MVDRPSRLKTRFQAHFFEPRDDITRGNAIVADASLAGHGRNRPRIKKWGRTNDAIGPTPNHGGEKAKFEQAGSTSSITDRFVLPHPVT